MKKIANMFGIYRDALIISSIFISIFIFFTLSLNLISYEYLLVSFLFINIYFIIRVVLHFFSENLIFAKLFLPLFMGISSILYILYKLSNTTLAFENMQIYIILLLIIGEIIGSSTVSSIRVSVYKRSSDDTSKAYLPKLPLALQSKINFLVVNIVLLIVTISASILFFDEVLKSFWYVVFLFPILIHLLALALYFVFIDSSVIESNKKIFEEEDKNFLLDSIGKKLANKASKSCRKTTEQEYEIVKQCLKNGLDPNEIFEQRYTLLLPSTCCGDEKLVRLLIENGADVNFKSKLGMTPIYLASQHGAYDLTKLLLQNGANIDVPSTSEVKSPLIESTIQGNALIVREFIAYGADLNIKDLEGKRALDYAKEKGDTNIIKILDFTTKN